MKKFLKISLWVSGALLVAVSLRLALRQWWPSGYAAIWGAVPIYDNEEKNKNEKSALEKFDEGTAPDNHSFGESGGARLLSPNKPTLEKPDTLYATGRIWGKGLVWVVMSDGTVRSMDDNIDPKKPIVERIRRHYMDMDGRRYYYRPKSTPATAPQLTKAGDLSDGSQQTGAVRPPGGG